MEISSLAKHLNSLPLYGLGIVFIAFGIDKFVLHERMVSWFMATPRARILVPTTDLSTFIYALGIVEIVIGVLLLVGIFRKATSIASTAMLVVIMITAQYPSSFPQDIGLIGISVMLLLRSTKRTIGEAKLQLLVRSSISIVLILWAFDHALDTDLHASWLQLFNTTWRSLPSQMVHTLVLSIAAVEIIIGGMLASGNFTRYFAVAAATFFAIAYVVLAPPQNNYQSIGLAIASLWFVFANRKHN
jgi:uncharacterized membrane protein YphA (DoxX/SURF4 family)